MISSCRWFRDQTLHLKKTNAQQVHMTSWYSMMLPPVVNHNSSIEPDAGNSAVNLRPGSPVRWTTAAFSKPQWRKLADTSLSFSCCASCECDYTNYNKYYINHDYIRIGYLDINIKGNVRLHIGNIGHVIGTVHDTPDVTIGREEKAPERNVDADKASKATKAHDSESSRSRPLQSRYNWERMLEYVYGTS
jgi:hypothetical protein